MQKHSMRLFATRGLAAAAIAAGLTLAPMTVFAEEVQPVAPADAATQADDRAPAAATLAAPESPAAPEAPAAPESPAAPELPAALKAPAATEAAPTEESTPTQELEAAQNEQASAQADYNEATSEVSEQTAVKNAADQALSEAEKDAQGFSGIVPTDEEVAQKQHTVIYTQDMVDWATQVESDAEAEQSAAETDNQAKQSAVSAAKSDLDQKQSAADDAQAKADANPVSAAQQQVDSAQAALDAATSASQQAQTAEEFLDSQTNGFYSHGYQQINQGAYGSDLRVDGSAATYQHLLDGCDVMDEVNRQRAAIGLSELPVDPYLVGVEVLEADINDGSYRGHSDWQKSAAYKNACLAWGYGPQSAVADGWMGEKANFDRFRQAHPTVQVTGQHNTKTYHLDLVGTPQMEEGTGYAIFMAYPDEYQGIGHYLAMVDPYNKTQGAGFGGRNTAAWIGGTGAHPSQSQAGVSLPTQTYSVSEWRSMIQNAKAIFEASNTDPTSLRDALSRAKANLATAQDLEKKAKAAQAAAGSAREAYDQAKSAADDAAARLSKANADLSEAQSTLRREQSFLADAQAAYDQAVRDRDAGQRANVAGANLPQLRANAASASTALQRAKDAQSKAKSRLDSANARLSAAQSAWNQAASSDTLYRVYNPVTGEYLFTTSMSEVRQRQSAGWNLQTDQTRQTPRSGVAVWCLRNPISGDRNYVSDQNEVRVLTNILGWVFENNGNPVFYGAKSATNVPYYRLFSVGSSHPHLFTPDADQRSQLLGSGWIDEGVAWYGVVSAEQPPEEPAEPAAPTAYYAIRYDGNGGTGVIDPQAVAAGKGTYLSYGSGLSRAGYNLLGWADTATSGKVWNLGQWSGALSGTDGAVVTLYAVWDAIPYTINYNGNGADSGSVSSQTAKPGETVTIAHNGFGRTGYWFSDWDTTPDGRGNDYAAGSQMADFATPGSTVTLYAQWSPNYYAVHYDNNGGVNQMADTPMTYDEATQLSANVFTREGYTFVGWSTSSYVMSVTYADQASVRNLTAGYGDIVTLYAVWAKNDDGRLLDDGSYLIRVPNHTELALGESGTSSGSSVVLQEYFGWTHNNNGTAAGSAAPQEWSFEWDPSAGGYKITNEQSGLVLGLDSRETYGGSYAQVEHDEGAPYDRWKIRETSGDGFSGYQLVNCGSGCALDMSEGWKVGAGVRQYAAYSGGEDQVFVFTPLEIIGEKQSDFAVGRYVIKLCDYDWQCLEIPSDNTENGAPVQVGYYDGSSNQQWEISKNDDGTYTISSVAAGYAGRTESFDVTGWNLASGVKLEVWDSTGNQLPTKWMIYRNDDGTYTFLSALSRLVVSLPQDYGTQLEMRPNGHGTNVRFNLVQV